MQNNQEAEFRDWVSKTKYSELVNSFNNSCGLKKQIISDEIDRRFNLIEENYYLNEVEKTPILNTGISPESLERRLNRKLP